MTERRFISIVMPALNEAAHISAAIASITPRAANIDHEILVMDGGSVDGTQAIVQALSTADPRIRLVSNPRRTQAAAMNLAARIADSRAAVLLRADCHSEYPENFVALCLDAMAEKKCASVVVPMETRGSSCMQKAIAAAQNSILGNGGSAHRLAGSSGYVEHGHHAAFDRAAYVAVGGYSEDMQANEDAELDRRLTQAGHKIWLCGAATIVYYPRANLRALARQYFAYGFGRATTCLRHRAMPKLRQVLPLVAFLGCLGSLVLALIDWRFLGLGLAYVALCLGWGAAQAMRRADACLLLSGVAAVTMHFAWAIGFLRRLLGHLTGGFPASPARGISNS